MFADLDDTIRELLIHKVPLSADDVDLTFEIPNREWSGRLTRPTINCFLYDVRENVKLRTIGWATKKSGDVGTRARGPLRFDVTYQVTAWARAREDEHRLLWRILVALVRNNPLPEELLQGLMKEQPMQVPTAVAQPEQMPGNIGDLWQGLDNPIHPSLTYVVTLCLDPDVAFSAPLLFKPPRVDSNMPPGMQAAGSNAAATGAGAGTAGAAAAAAGGPPKGPVIGGIVWDTEHPGEPMAGALVTLRETGGRVLTREDGGFFFTGVPLGKVTLTVRAAGREERTFEAFAPSLGVQVEI